MSPVQNIKVGHIDPDSEINVRRQGIEQNVEKVKASIQQHGYWQISPLSFDHIPILSLNTIINMLRDNVG